MSEQIFKLDTDFSILSDSISNLNKNLNNLNDSNDEFYRNTASLQNEVIIMATQLGCENDVEKLFVDSEIISINKLISDIAYEELYKYVKNNAEIALKHKIINLPKLKPEDYIFCSIAGLIGVMIDILFVGIPKTIRDGKEYVDDAPITEILHNLGKKSPDSKELSKLLKLFEEKFKVPYDLSTIKGEGVYPKNHRLKSLGHDPLIGLIFAISDIYLGTTTYISNNGKLMIQRTKNVDKNVKILSVLYYIGHLVSDVCTSKGLPIPGWCLSLFFTVGELGPKDKTLAAIAEEMYINGYDLRHLASMSTSVLVTNLLVDIYFKLNYKKEDYLGMPIYEKESIEIQNNLVKHKLLWVANSVATTGNVMKFICPPACGNPNAINVVQWLTLVRESNIMIQAIFRENTAEIAFENRDQISTRWIELWTEVR